MEREQKLIDAIATAIGWLRADEISREEIREFLKEAIRANRATHDENGSV